MGTIAVSLRGRLEPAVFRASVAQSRQLHMSNTRRKEERAEPTADAHKRQASTDAPGAEPEKENAKDTKEGEDGAKDNKEKEDGDKSKDQGQEGKNKKEDMPPPPPHGDKTPWQVFMETMDSEFQKSKEWNESTKQIGAAAHQFTESESVRKAREAYERSTGAVSSTASKAVKSTAGAIGKGAAWTWETPVMKGVRKAANVTGEAVDKATKPIRDTEAYKNVKDVIDDGSSSRYGGWVEKEERRKRRALMEAQRAKGDQVMEEDPK